MSEWEREALDKCPLKPIFYLRFLDDIIGAWEHGEDNFYIFVDILNKHHSSIKIKHNIHSEEITFLDTTVFFEHIDDTSKRLLSRVYFKPTDTHALLHKLSYHPKHTFQGIVKSQIIRFCRISSREADLNQAISILFHSLRQRGYSRRLLRRIKKQTLLSFNPSDCTSGFSIEAGWRRSREAKHNDNQNQLIPLVITYSRPYVKLQNLWKNNFYTTMADHDQFQNYKIISAFRRNKNLKDLLVRAKFCKEATTDRSSKHWAFFQKNYLFNIHGNMGIPIIVDFNLHSSNLVYCITCQKCGIMYMGETGNTLLTRLLQHIRSIKIARLPTPLVKHFQIHPLRCLTITGVQTCATWTEGQRRRQERLWIEKLKTNIPLGLNI